MQNALSHKERNKKEMRAQLRTETAIKTVKRKLHVRRRKPLEKYNVKI